VIDLLSMQLLPVSCYSLPVTPRYLSQWKKLISLLPILSKLFKKLLLKRLKPKLDEKQIIPTHQFGFRNKHWTIDQVHRITTVIEKTLGEKKVCSTIFLDVAQAFDKVWHEGLLHKIEQLLPAEHSQLLKSYLSDRYCRVKQEDE